jgi:hypothetical protein
MPQTPQHQLNASQMSSDKEITTPELKLPHL